MSLYTYFNTTWLRLATIMAALCRREVPLQQTKEQV